jgi:hypothetical protein
VSGYNEPVEEKDLSAALIQQCASLEAEMKQAIEDRNEEAQK